MRQPNVDDRVRLTRDIPELSLNRGVTGVVRSTWFAPWTAYEVEFQPDGAGFQTRALLMAEQVEVADELASDESTRGADAASDPLDEEPRCLAFN